MPTLRTRCTHCGQGLTLKKPDLVGRKVPCPSCRQPFVVRPIKAAKSATKKAPQATDDDILDAELVEAEEVENATGGDDDWLDALDSLPPVAAAGTEAGGPTGEAPRVSRSSRKKKSSSSGKKKRRRIRDADGELPLWLHRLLMIGCGLVGGVLATLLWAGLISAMENPSSYMAIFVGVFVGTAVRLGASKWDYGWWPALTASGIAFVSIFAGKIAGFHMMKGKAEEAADEHNAAYVAMLQHEDYPIYEIALDIEGDRAMADEVILRDSLEWEMEAMDRFTNDDGSPNWSEVYNPDYFSERFEGTWEDARQRWQEMPDDEKELRRQAIEAQISAVESSDVEFYGEYETNIYGTRIITPFDFLFSIVAIIGAFKIAAGMTDDEDDEAGIY